MSLEIVFWDVQHGNATYIKSPNGRNIVQDLGTGSYGKNNVHFSPLLYLQSSYDVKKLDLVIITHPHKDHINDIMNFDKLSPRSVFLPEHLTENDIFAKVREEDWDLFEKYFDISRKYNKPASPENAASNPENFGGVEIKFFVPKSCNVSNINNHSAVTVLSYANSKVILPGDNESCAWKELLERDRFLDSIEDADILLASHHGRQEGYYQELFDSFQPKLTIISDGRFCDTSATDRYSAISNGWEVYHRNGEKEERKCLTTRKDGVIVVKLGYNKDQKPYINVTVD